MAKNFIETTKKVHTLKATGLYIDDEGQKCIDIPDVGVIPLEDLLKNFKYDTTLCIQITEKVEEEVENND